MLSPKTNAVGAFFRKDSPYLLMETRDKRWAIPYHYEALNSRVENIIFNNSKYIRGKRVLDLGSHYGSFAYGALKCGCEFIHCVDSEERLIRQGETLF